MTQRFLLYFLYCLSQLEMNLHSQIVYNVSQIQKYCQKIPQLPNHVMVLLVLVPKSHFEYKISIITLELENPIVLGILKLDQLFVFFIQSLKNSACFPKHLFLYL